MRPATQGITLFPYTTLFRSGDITKTLVIFLGVSLPVIYHSFEGARAVEEKMLWSGAAMGLSTAQRLVRIVLPDRKSTRLNSSHRCISYAVFCLKKKSHALG